MEKQAELAVPGLFDELSQLIENVAAEESFIGKETLRHSLAALKASFADDYGRILPAADVLFGEDYRDFGARSTDIFRRWEGEGGGPPLTALVALAADRFGLDLAAPAVKGAFLAAIMAEIPNGLQYHGNEHYRKVLYHCLRLIATNNIINKDTSRALNREQIATMLIASCIHDLGHEGVDNLRDGVYTPGKMEQQAFDLARPYLAALGVAEGQLGEIETIVFCTDITFFAGDNSPCIRMKKIFKHFFWDDDRDDVSMMMMGKLRRYEDNPRLVLMAMLLHEADIASSAGLSYEQTIKETINIMEERGVTTAGPRTVIAFLREQLGETMFTEASKQLYGKVMASVIRQAEDDIARGRKTFYED